MRLTARGAGCTPLFLAVLLMLPACGGDPPESPEERLRRLFDKAETAVEARELADAAELISLNYRDPSRRGYREMRSLLAGYLLRHRSIHLIKQVDSLELISPKQAQAVLYVGVAGTRDQAIDSLSQWTGDLVRLDLELALEEDDAWRLRSARWRRASRGDILH